MKKVILAAALISVFGLANATPGNNGGGNGGCGNGQQTNGCGDQGGAGGAVGHSGTGIGVGVGIGHGGSVTRSGNSHNANSNKNTNTNSNRNNNSNLNAQGQKQGQAQSSRNDNRSNASNSNSNANSGNNSNQSVTVQGDTYEQARVPVSTAYAPNIMPTAVCMGSSSGGFSGASVSVSLGSSWTDANCMLLEQVRTVAAVIGDRETAQEMMCDVPAYAKARERTGKPCAGSGAPSLSSVTVTPTAAEKKAGYTGTDPIIRKRLGLPPM